MMTTVERQTPGAGTADVLSVQEGESTWVVLHTRPRCEKKVVQYCGQLGVPVYLPLRRREHRYGARRRAFLSPLFPGYVFCVVGPCDQGKVRQNRHVANVLVAVDQAKLVGQLRQIRHVLEVGDVAEVQPYLESGRRVRVRGGPFRGLEGIVQRVKGRTRVVINVDMIQQAVALEVEGDLLDPA